MDQANAKDGAKVVRSYGHKWEALWTPILERYRLGQIGILHYYMDGSVSVYKQDGSLVKDWEEFEKTLPPLPTKEPTHSTVEVKRLGNNLLYRDVTGNWIWFFTFGETQPTPAILPFPPREPTKEAIEEYRKTLEAEREWIRKNVAGLPSSGDKWSNGLERYLALYGLKELPVPPPLEDAAKEPQSPSASGDADLPRTAGTCTVKEVVLDGNLPYVKREYRVSGWKIEEFTADGKDVKVDPASGQDFTVSVVYQKEPKMKLKKLKSLFDFYYTHLANKGYQLQANEKGLACLKDQLQDVMYRCIEGKKTVEEGYEGEAMKLLGWIQGILNFGQVFTRKQLDEHLKPRDPRQVTIDYTNYKGERRKRDVIPDGSPDFYGSNEWHKETQWLFTAFDVEDGMKLKSFTRKDVHSWTPHPED